MDRKRQRFGEHLRVLRAQSGDREALDELLRSVQGPLFGYIRGVVGNSAMAEDVLQDVLLAICRNLRHLREPKVFRAWAYRIASRRALRVTRRERARGEWSLDEAGMDPAEPAPETEETYRAHLVAELPSWLAAVSPASRAVLSLHYLENMTLHETADVLDIPLGTAKSRLSYGLASIREAIRARAKSPIDKEITNE